MSVGQTFLPSNSMRREIYCLDKRKLAWSLQRLATPRLMQVMLARLGNVLYWFGCMIAAALMLGAIGVEADEDKHFLAGTAIVLWLLGRACRYVLSGDACANPSAISSAPTSWP